MRLLPLSVLLAANLVATAARADDAGVNAVYERMSAAYAAADAVALSHVYAEDAIVFPSQANRAPVLGRDSIARGPGGFLGATRAQGGALAISFRITQRRALGDTVVDAGVYRLEITPAAGGPHVQVGKFMTVSARQADGRWAFVGDTDTPMPAAAWEQAKPLPGAKFDR